MALYLQLSLSNHYGDNVNSSPNNIFNLYRAADTNSNTRRHGTAITRKYHICTAIHHHAVSNTRTRAFWNLTTPTPRPTDTGTKSSFQTLGHLGNPENDEKPYFELWYFRRRPYPAAVWCETADFKSAHILTAGTPNIGMSLCLSLYRHSQLTLLFIVCLHSVCGDWKWMGCDELSCHQYLKATRRRKEEEKWIGNGYFEGIWSVKEWDNVLHSKPHRIQCRIKINAQMIICLFIFIPNTLIHHVTC